MFCLSIFDTICNFLTDDYIFISQDNIIEFIDKISKTYTCKQTILKEIVKHETIFNTVQTILHLLNESIKIRLKSQPNKCRNCLISMNECCHSTVGILFSGGLDCTILAFLADRYVHKNQTIDLINVSFKTENGTYDVPDRITGKQSYNELKQICPTR